MTYINPRQKVLWHTDRLHDLRTTGTTRAPVNVEIDLSNRCSHGCRWCRFAYTHTRGPLAGTEKPDSYIPGGDLMDYDLAKRILKELWAAGVKSVTWTGGGEPTLHPHFDDIITYAAGLGLEQGIYTHGGHIDDAKAHLIKRRLTFAYVSLDECTRSSFRASKGVDRFEQVCDGIRRLALSPGPATVGVGFLLHAGNIHQVDQMASLGHNLGASYVQFRPLIAYGDEPRQLAEDAGWVENALYALAAYHGDPFVIADRERFRMYRDWAGHAYSVCNWSAMQTAITPNGKMWRCTDKREHADALLGDLTQESFAGIWQRAGGPCAVNDQCRLMCRGNLSNLTLDAIMTEPAHANFI